jgi:hypothetical protein
MSFCWVGVIRSRSEEFSPRVRGPMFAICGRPLAFRECGGGAIARYRLIGAYGAQTGSEPLARKVSCGLAAAESTATI